MMSNKTNGADALDCPHCGFKIDAHVATKEKARPPETGDAMVCHGCKKIAMYTAENTLRKPTAAELREVHRLHPELEDLIDGVS
jgi:hypothetical protein